MRKTIVGTALATAAAAVAGSVASRQGVETWYPTLRKPPYNPPNAVFPIAWTTLYADIAATSAATIDRFRADGESGKANAYVAALGANLVLNAGWSWVFFKMHKLGPSVVAAGALAASSATWPGALPTRTRSSGRPWRPTRCGARSRRCCPPASGGATARTPMSPVRTCR